MAHLFFSYAHDDYARLLPVFQRMELVTERMIWIDRIGLQRDAEWASMIQRAIKSSCGVIFAVTKTFVERPFILDKEIPWALERFNDSRQGKLLFPILFDDVPLPKALNGPNVQFCKQIMDARDGDYERMIQELKQVIPEPTGEDYPFVVSWPRLRNFRGRDQQLVELHYAMHTEDGKAGIKTAGMYGTGGIGKTQLAVEFAYRYRFYFPGGVFWLNAAQNWQDEIADCADHLGLEPIDPNDTNRNKQMTLAFKQYREQSGQEALLVLDNVENPADLTTREIAPKLTIPNLCSQSRTRLIITTRVQTLPEGFARVEVAKLTPADALAVLLDAWQGGQETPPRPDPPDEAALNELAQLFDYLPLPLGWMAAALRQKPTLQPARLLDNLRQQGVDETIDRLKQGGVSLGTPVYYEALVGAGLDWQMAQCGSDDALHLLTLIAAYNEAAVVPVARLRLLASFGTDDLLDPFDEALDALEKYSLVETQRSGGAVRLHPLEHAHLRRTHPDYCTRLGEAAGRLVGAYRTPDVLVRETLARGFDAVLTDLRETQPAVPAEAPILSGLSELLRYFDWEAYHLRGQYLAERPSHDSGLSLIQHLRERAHHQGTDAALRDNCDDWLEAQRLPHLRSYESWRHPHDPAMIRILEGHRNWVDGVAFAPDGRTALSGSWDNTVRLWDVASGTELRRFEGHRGRVFAVAFAPDGRTVLSGSEDKTLRLWDVASGTELRRFEGHSRNVIAVAFAPDGRTALSGSSDMTLRWWNVANGAELRRFEGHEGEVFAAAFAPDGRTALSGSEDKTLRLWDMISGAELRRFQGHSEAVHAVAFAPDGRAALSGSSDKTLRLWDVVSGTEVRRFEGHNAPVHTVAFAPDGHTALSGSWDHTLRLWDVVGGIGLRRFESHKAAVRAVAFAPDSRSVLSGSWDHTLRLWDVAHGTEVRRFEGHSGRVNAVAFSPDGRKVLSGSDDQTLRLWRMSRRRLREFAAKAELRRFEGHSGRVNAVAFSPDGRTALSGSGDHTLRLWDVAHGTELRRFEGHSDEVTAVTFAPDGRTALSGALDGTLRLWDVVGGMERYCFRGHSETVWTVAVSPDGRTVLSGSQDSTLRLWDVASGAEIRRFVGRSDTVHIIDFAPEAHRSAIFAVAFSPDGRYALSGSSDNMLQLWDVTSGVPLSVLRLDAPLLALAMAATTPPSVAVGDDSGGLRVLRLYVPH